MEEEFNELIGKYFLGELSRSERDQLKEWIFENPKNLAQFRFCYKLKRTKSSPQLHLNTFIRINQISEKMEQIDEEERKARIRFQRVWLLRAACISLLIMFGYLSFHKIGRSAANADFVAVTIPISEQEVDKTLKPSLPAYYTEEPYKKVVLPDSSIVFLRAGSHLNLLNNLFGDTREVKLQGEAYFEIAHNPDKPFIVHSDEGEIKVLGTKFNVSNREEFLKVALRSGSVQYQNKEGVSLLKPGQLLELDLVTGNRQIKGFDENEVLDWTRGIIRFNQVPLAKIIEQINIHYLADYKLSSNENFDELMLTGTFQDVPLTELITIIEDLLNLKTITHNEEKIITKVRE